MFFGGTNLDHRQTQTLIIRFIAKNIATAAKGNPSATRSHASSCTLLGIRNDVRPRCPALILAWRLPYLQIIRGCVHLWTVN